MMRLMFCGVGAVVVLIFVQSTNPIISIHRSSTPKMSCQSTEWIKSDSEDLVCQSASDDPDPAGIDKIFVKHSAMFYSLISAMLVGLTGILPLLTIKKAGNNRTEDSKSLNRLLSFAVGSMLGDVFLHLLPETWDIPLAEGETLLSRSKRNGFWLMLGLLCFCTLEKLLPDEKDTQESQTETPTFQNSNGNNNIKTLTSETDGIHQRKVSNGQLKSEHIKDSNKNSEEEPQSVTNIKMSGYLNLFANFTDNFTHGLAIGGSYLVSFQVGLLTTLAILLHEIPHEFGDFAILLRAGYTHQEAAKRQLLTASGGLLGAIFAHLVGSDAAAVGWILPFTSGGFIYIALCTVVPDLVQETTSTKESVVHLSLMILGVVVMGLVGLIE